MVPNPNWDDFALDREFEAMTKRLDMLEHAHEGLSHFPIDLAKATLNIEHLAGQIDSARHEIQDVRATCDQFHKEWRRSMDARSKGRTMIVVAIITGSFAVLASIAAALLGLAG